MPTTQQQAIIAQNQRLLQRLNTSCTCDAEVRQLLQEILGHPIDASVAVQRPFYTDYGHNVTLGRRVRLASNVMLSGLAPIRLDDDVVIGAETYLTTDSGPHQPERAIHVRRGAWIGPKVIVFPGVTIGRNAVVQLGARVVTDVPDNTVVAGAPAVVLSVKPNKEILK